MEHLRKVLLMASVATILPAQVLSQSSLSYEKTLSVAIHFYNQKPQDQRLKLLSFAMKEMVCPRTGELPLDQCNFKRDGLVKKCQGSISNEQDIPSIILTCDPVAPVTPAPPGFTTSSKKKGKKKLPYTVIFGRTDFP